MATVRHARSADLDELADLVVGFRDFLGYPEPSRDSVRSSLERLLDDPAAEHLLAADEPGSPATGFCALRFRYGLWHAAPDCWLEDLYVTEEARGRGVGAALTAAALDRARAWGAARIELDVNETNDPALALYRSHGFEVSTKMGGRDVLMRAHVDGLA